jgi:hypothetical protein
MSSVLRSLLDRLGQRLRRTGPQTFASTLGDDTDPRRLDIVLSELPPDWVQSLESGDVTTDYDVRSLGEPIDPGYPRR